MYEDVCQPDLRVKFVFGQMLRWTHVPDLKDSVGIDSDANLQGTDWLGTMGAAVQQGAEGLFTNLFLGLMKALVGLQIFLMALIIGIMADMLTAMVIAAMPVFLMLTLLPKGEELANKFIEAIPALLLLPMMSAVILVVGAASIAEGPAGGEVTGPFGHIFVWIMSIGVVFFAITLPVTMVPLLKSATQMATQVVSSAVSTGAMVTGTAAAGAAHGMSNVAQSASAASVAGGGAALGKMGLLKAATGMAGMGAAAKGMVGGIAQGQMSVAAPSLGQAGAPLNVGSITRPALSTWAATGPGSGIEASTRGQQAALASSSFDSAMKSGQSVENFDKLGKMAQQNEATKKMYGNYQGYDKNLSMDENMRRAEGAMLHRMGNKKPLSSGESSLFGKIRGALHGFMTSRNMTPDNVGRAAKGLKDEAHNRGETLSDKDAVRELGIRHARRYNDPEHLAANSRPIYRDSIGNVERAYNEHLASEAERKSHGSAHGGKEAPPDPPPRSQEASDANARAFFDRTGIGRSSGQAGGGPGAGGGEQAGGAAPDGAQAGPNWPPLQPGRSQESEDIARATGGRGDFSDGEVKHFDDHRGQAAGLAMEKGYRPPEERPAYEAARAQEQSMAQQSSESQQASADSHYAAEKSEEATQAAQASQRSSEKLSSDVQDLKGRMESNADRQAAPAPAPAQAPPPQDSGRSEPAPSEGRAAGGESKRKSDDSG